MAAVAQQDAHDTKQCGGAAGDGGGCLTVHGIFSNRSRGG
jgi:hypothetical protein